MCRNVGDVAEGTAYAGAMARPGRSDVQTTPVLLPISGKQAWSEDMLQGPWKSFVHEKAQESLGGGCAARKSSRIQLGGPESRTKENGHAKIIVVDYWPAGTNTFCIVYTMRYSPERDRTKDIFLCVV